jgi:mRNA interferase MazF
MVGVKRGDIWLVDLNPTKGGEQKGIRPCIIISNDLTNKYAPTVCAIPLTGNLDGKKFPINLVLKKEDTGLNVDSLALCGQIRTIAKDRLSRKLSSINPNCFNFIENALLLYLGI